MKNIHHLQRFLIQGQKLTQTGRFLEAEAAFKQALSLNKKNPEALYLLATLYRSISRQPEAIELYKRALKISRNMLPALINLSASYAEIKDYVNALATCDKALKTDPGNIAILNIKGLSLIKLGEPAKALTSLNQAVTSNANHALVHNNRGLALREIGQLSDARLAFQKAVDLMPNNVQHRINLSNILSEMAKTDEAMEAYRNVIKLQPNLPLFQYNYFNLLESANRVELLQNELPQILSKFPSNLGLNLIAAKLDRRCGKVKDALTRLKPYAKLEKTPDILESAIQFELGKCYDILGKPDEAYAAFTEANQHAELLTTQGQITRNNYSSQISSCQNWVATQNFSTWKGPYKIKQPAPVFLTGFARTGTTLLEQFLGGHPNLKTYEEKPMLSDTILHITSKGFNYPHDLGELHEKELDILREKYFNHANEYGENDRILVDKNPMLTTHLGLVQRIFPDSKVIFLERHPFDVVLSCYMQYFSFKNQIGNMFTMDQIARCYDQVMTLGRTYRDRLPLSIKAFRYEDVVDDHEKAAREIIDFLGLQWQDSVLDYKKTALDKKRIQTPSYHQVSQDIYSDAKYRWQRYAKHLEPVRHILEPHAIAMGYEI